MISEGGFLYRKAPQLRIKHYAFRKKLDLILFLPAIVVENSLKSSLDHQKNNLDFFGCESYADD